MKIELPAGASVEARDGKLTLQLPSKSALAELQRDAAGKLADLLSSAAERLREEKEESEPKEKRAKRSKRVLRHYQVAEIKCEIEDRGSNWSESKIRAWAKKYAVSPDSIRRVLKGDTFKDVEPAPPNQAK